MGFIGRKGHRQLRRIDAERFAVLEEDHIAIWGLAAVRIGNTITVKRADGKTAEYTVSAVRSYPDKAKFPTELVYGGDLSAPTLRIITCANFNQQTRHYAGNTVVFAKFNKIK